MTLNSANIEAVCFPNPGTAAIAASVPESVARTFRLSPIELDKWSKVAKAAHMTAN